MVLETKMKAIIAAIFFIHLVSIHATFRIAPGQYLTNNGPSMSQSDRMGFGRPPRRMTPLADDMEDYSDSAIVVPWNEIEEYAHEQENEIRRLVNYYCCGPYKLLHLAALEGCVEVAEFITSVISSANIDDVDSDGMTAVHWAAMSGNVRVLQVLLEGKANIFTVDKQNNTALHHATNSGNSETSWWLLQRGIDVDAQNIKQETAIHLAVRRGDYNMAQTILNYAAMTNISDNDRKVPLDIALEKNDLRLIKLLQSSGAKRFMKEVHGNHTLEKQGSQCKEENLLKKKDQLQNEDESKSEGKSQIEDQIQKDIKLSTRTKLEAENKNKASSPIEPPQSRRRHPQDQSLGGDKSPAVNHTQSDVLNQTNSNPLDGDLLKKANQTQSNGKTTMRKQIQPEVEEPQEREKIQVENQQIEENKRLDKSQAKIHSQKEDQIQQEIHPKTEGKYQEKMKIRTAKLQQGENQPPAGDQPTTPFEGEDKLESVQISEQSQPKPGNKPKVKSLSKEEYQSGSQSESKEKSLETNQTSLLQESQPKGQLIEENQSQTEAQPLEEKKSRPEAKTLEKKTELDDQPHLETQTQQVNKLITEENSKNDDDQSQLIAQIEDDQSTSRVKNKEGEYNSLETEPPHSTINVPREETTTLA